jgi:hypothetical protein
VALSHQMTYVCFYARMWERKVRTGEKFLLIRCNQSSYRQDQPLPDYTAQYTDTPVFSKLYHPRHNRICQRRHTTEFRLPKRRYETKHGHKYVSTYTYCKNADMRRQNLTRAE